MNISTDSHLRGEPVAFLSRNGNLYFPQVNKTAYPIQLVGSGVPEHGTAKVAETFTWDHFSGSSAMFTPLYKGDTITIEL